MTGVAKKISSFILVRFSISSAVNTLAGISIFPIIKTLFFDVDLLLLMTVSYVICLMISFATHNYYTFKVSFSIRRIFSFTILQCFLLFANYFITKSFGQILDADVRIIQPIVAVALQFASLGVYRRIFN